MSDHKSLIIKSEITVIPVGIDHIKNCKTGYCTAPFRWWWQAHHLIPVSALKNEHIAQNSEDLNFIWNYLFITDWDINAGPNMIGLDTKWPYYTQGFGKYPMPPNLPSHLIEHNQYTAYSYRFMSAKVWAKLKKQRRSADPHKLPTEGLKAQLEDGSKHFRFVVEAYGKREGGTLLCWSQRHQKAMEDKWYKPFSMGASPGKRHPGMPGTTYLDKLFKKMK
jgi:hypothetical protein